MTAAVSQTFPVKITVLNANAAPMFDQHDGWQVFEGQHLAFTAFAYDADNPYFMPSHAPHQRRAGRDGTDPGERDG